MRVKVARVLQILALVLVVGYLVLLGYANPQTIILPFLPSLPTAWVLAVALLLGALVGWLSLSGRVFRLNRENRSLRQRLIKAGLEAEPEEPSGKTGVKARGRVAIIPDKAQGRKPPT